MFKKWLLLVFFLVLTASVFEKLISLQNHTLQKNNSWISNKQLSVMPFGLMGVNEFVSERQALADENLNLGVWFGNQDVTLKETGFDGFKVKFKLEPDSYLWTFLNCDTEKCLALRTSANADFPGGVFFISPEGRFISQMAQFAVVSAGAHVVKVADAKVFVDEAEVYRLPDLPLLVRLRNGLLPVRIEEVEIFGKSAMSFNFRSDFRWLRWLVFLGLLLGFSLAVLQFKKNWNYVFLVNFCLLILGFIFLGFDKYYWSHLYLTDEVNPEHEVSQNFVLDIEQWRKNMFEVPAFAKPVAEIKIDDFQVIAADGSVVARENIDDEILKYGESRRVLKIAIVGGSQSWGGGASSLTATWGAKLIKKVAAVSQREVIGINFSVCGGTLFNSLQRLYPLLKFKPDLVIVNFGFNDEVTPDLYFQTELRQLSGRLRGREIPALYSIEAQSYEYNKAETQKSALIRRVLAAEKIGLVSLHEHLASAEVRDRGLLWQDQVHFTDFGHDLVADFFINSVAVKKLTSK